MEYFVTPNKPSSYDSNLGVGVMIINPVFYPFYRLGIATLSSCYNENRVYMNYILGSEPAPDYLPFNDFKKYSGIYLLIDPRGNDWSTKQYLIIFKSDGAENWLDPLIEIYHNSDRVESEQIVHGDDRFALIVPCDGTNYTHLYFRLANFSGLWFKEIEVQLI